MEKADLWDTFFPCFVVLSIMYLQTSCDRASGDIFVPNNMLKIMFTMLVGHGA